MPAPPPDSDPDRPARWVRDGVWSVLDQALFAGGNFVLNVLLARWLAPEAYGAFTVAFVVFLLVGTVHGGLFVEPLLVFGPGRFEGRTRPYLRVLLGGHAVFSGGAAVLLGTAGGAAWALGSPALGVLLGVLALGQGFVLALWLLRRACYVVERPDWAAGAGALYLAVLVAGAFGLREAGLLSGVTALALMAAGSLLASVALAVRLGVPLRPARGALGGEAREAHVGYGRWAAWTGVLEWAALAVPYLALPVFVGLEASGALRALYNLAMPALQGFGALATLALPLFVRARAEGRLRDTAAKVGAGMVGLSLAYAALVLVGGRAAVAWLYDGQYAVGWASLGLLAALPVVNAGANVLATLLRSDERPAAVFRARAWATGVAATVGTGLTAAFGVAGALGSDVVALLTESAVAGRALGGKRDGAGGKGEVHPAPTPARGQESSPPPGQEGLGVVDEPSGERSEGAVEPARLVSGGGVGAGRPARALGGGVGAVAGPPRSSGPPPLSPPVQEGDFSRTATPPPERVALHRRWRTCGGRTPPAPHAPEGGAGASADPARGDGLSTYAPPVLTAPTAQAGRGGLPDAAPPPAPRLRVLVSAYACAPGEGSEPSVGWNFAREMAGHHDVWLLTHGDVRGRIERELAARPVAGLRVVYHSLPLEKTPEEGGAEELDGLRQQLHYDAWQRTAARVARRLHREVGFDVVHHKTFVKHWAPSALRGLGAPFVWGPVGGGESAPPAFYDSLGEAGRRYETVRDLARWLGERLPSVRRTARAADWALATTDETRARMEAMGARDVEVESAIGMPAAEVERLGAYPLPDDGPARFLCVGRQLAWKGYHLALDAFAEAARDPAFDASLWLVGDGPEHGRLRERAEALGLGDRVRFTGALPRPEVLKLLAASHALVQTSLHDSGGGVCLEALAAGRPVVGFRLGGTAVHVAPDAGVLVPAEAPGPAVAALAAALRRVAADPEGRRAMGRAGRRSVRESHAWEDRVAATAARYRRLVGRPAPDHPARPA